MTSTDITIFSMRNVIKTQHLPGDLCCVSAAPIDIGTTHGLKEHRALVVKK